MREELLIWYDENRRKLPWRVERPEPYHVLLSEIMLQQTTTTAVKPYYEKFLANWPRMEDLARAQDEDVMRAWAGLGYYSRARNLLKAVREIVALGDFPKTSETLVKLSGVGAYTSAAVAAIAFGEAILPIDGNVKRVLARYEALDDPIDKPSAALQTAAEKWAGVHRPGDVAQAFMDLGATICRPKNPLCAACPLAQGCQAHLRDVVNDYPKRTAKRPKKNWIGHAYIIETPEGVVFEKRDAGLLKGMDALPAVMGETVDFAPPFAANWRKCGEITHVFTHIDLRLTLWKTSVDKLSPSNTWFVLNKDEQRNIASLWRKALQQNECRDEE